MVGEDELNYQRKKSRTQQKSVSCGKNRARASGFEYDFAHGSTERHLPENGPFGPRSFPENGKKVDFIIEGDDVEIDRNMVDMMADPFGSSYPEFC